MKQLLVMLVLLCSAVVNAQDVIVKKDGSTIVCRVVNLTDSEIIYKKWSDLNGSNYVMERSAASAINYQNGKKVNLSEATNLYRPNNQNDGVQQYNDRALLAIDNKSNILEKKAKNWQTVGWICGGILVGYGLYIIIDQPFLKHDGNHKRETPNILIGSGIAGIGIISSILCFSKARNIRKQAEMLQSASIYQHDFKFSNGSSLSAGIDMLSDCILSNNTLGFGVRYNF